MFGVLHDKRRFLKAGNLVLGFWLLGDRHFDVGWQPVYNDRLLFSNLPARFGLGLIFMTMLVVAIAVVHAWKYIALLERVGWCVLLVGGLWNAAEFFWMGRVLDYFAIRFPVFGVGVYNTADALVIMGAMVVCVSIVRNKKNT